MSGHECGATARFGGPAPEPVDWCLREAASAHADGARAERLLQRAHRLGPHCLPVYFALYKFYFHQCRLAEAETAALLGLDTAARQAGFAADWRQLAPGSAAWGDTAGPQRFYLFSLKALAFVRLRLGRVDEARALLAKLGELDPSDSVGHGVVATLASAVCCARTPGAGDTDGRSGAAIDGPTAPPSVRHRGP